jgi:hypothetical protein
MGHGRQAPTTAALHLHLRRLGKVKEPTAASPARGVGRSDDACARRGHVDELVSGHAPPWDSIVRTRAWDVVHAFGSSMLLLQPMAFDVVGSAELEMAFVMTVEEFADLLTQSNALASLQSGKTIEDELRTAILEDVEPLFSRSKVGTAVFGRPPCAAVG